MKSPLANRPFSDLWHCLCALALFVGLGGSAQDLRVTDPQLSAGGVVTLSHAAATNSYYILYRGETLDSIAVPRDLQPGLLPIGVLTDRPPRPETAFYRVREVPLDQPLDTDGDGLDDAYELSFGSLFNPLDSADGFADLDGDGYTNAEEVRLGQSPFVADPPRLAVVTASPEPGETGVAVTRETILRFSRPLAEGTQIDTTHLHATAAGRQLLARVELSSDRRTVTLFYLENLPASTRVRVTLDASSLRDTAGQLVDADGDGRAGGTLTLDFETLTITPMARTAIKGRVFASELVGANSVNQPLQGVTISVDGAEETIRTTTDADGNFTLHNCPAGRFFVHIDGRTAVGSQWPDGAYYPFVGKAWETAAGRDDNLAGDEPYAQRTGNIYLPLIAVGSLQPVSTTEETVVTFPASVLATHPELAGVELRVPANALFADSGARGGRVGIAPVPPDRLPSPLPGGLEFPLVITVQTDGPSNFDRPVPICFPNLPDPGLGVPLPPGEKNYLFSFNHDTGEWEAIGSMTVSADGKMICTDPGVGIVQPGWHGSGPVPDSPPGCKSLCCPNGSPSPGPAPLFSSQPSIGRQIMPLGDEEGEEFQCPPCRRDDNELRSHEAICFAEGQRLYEQCSLNFENCKKFFKTEETYKGAKCADDAILETTCLELKIQYIENCLKNCKKCSTASRQTAIAHVKRSSESLEIEIESIRSQIQSLVHPYVLSRSNPPQEVVDRVLQLFDDVERVVGGSAASYFGSRVLEIEREIARHEHVVGPVVGNAPRKSVAFAAFVSLGDGKVILTRGRTKAFGQYQIFKPRNGSIDKIVFLDEQSGKSATLYPNRAGGQLPRFFLGEGKGELIDDDRDQLGNLAELVLGTDAFSSDSDSDGIPDGVEVRNGTNPLDGRPVATGVIASQPLPANALDVCAFDNRAIVALGDTGVGVLSVFNGLAPTLVAQLDTPGSAHQVACAGNLVAVADGAAGLAIVDITTPTEAALVRQIPVRPLGGGETRSVATAADLVFAGQSSGFVAVIEAATGLVIQRMELGGSVESLAIEGVTLYAVAGGKLWVLPFATGVLDKRGSVDAGGGRLFVGNARAYVTIGRVAGNGGSGFRVFDVSNPDAPVALGQEITTQSNWKHLVPTGSGYGLGVVGINPSENTGDDVYLYDLRNGANTFVTRLETPGVAKAASLFNGLGYVADGEAGLQVVNYVAYDSKKLPPTGQLVLSTTNTATAGGYVVVRAEVEDDVQVRNVEFLLNGETLVTDGNFPFEVVYRVPTNQIGATLTFAARVFDTGGNTASLTNAPALTIMPDEEPPVIQVESPTPNARFILGDDIPVTVTARDNTGVATVVVRLDGQPARLLRLSGIDYVLLDPLPSGTHTIQAVAVDNSGREGVSEIVSFAIWRQAISREYSVFNFGAEEKPAAISREYSVFNFGAEDKPAAISREYSVFNFGAEEKPAAISREYSVFNFGAEEKPQAISREYSVENRPTE